MPNIIQVRNVLLKAPAVIIPPAGLGLQTNCTAFWEFENTSWLDATGNGTTLTGSGSPTSVAGKVGNAVSVTATGQYLTASSNANILNGGSSFSAQCWINSGGSAVTEGTIFNKDNNAFGQREWAFGVRFTTANVWSFLVSNTSTSLFRADAAASGAGLVAGSTWVHLLATFNSSTGAVVLYVNGSASGSGATLTGTMNSSASAPLNVGRNPSATINAASLIDQCGFWKGRVLSAGDVTALYNSGNGLSWAAMA